MKTYKPYQLGAFVFLLLYSVQAKTEYCSDTYRKKNSPAFKVEAFHAFDKDNLIIVCGAGLAVLDLPQQILTSKNGGRSWRLQKNLNDASISKIVFLGSRTGFAAGAQYSDKTAQGLILKTADGGMSWNKVSLEISESVEDIFFINNLDGFAVTDEGSFLATGDGGDNWKIIGRNALKSKDTNLARISFSDASAGWAITAEQTDKDNTIVDGEIYRTRDGGKSWSSQKEKFLALLRQWEPTGIRFFEINFFDSKTGYLAAHFEKIERKPNDGNRYIIFEGSAVFSTKDGGESWETKLVSNDFGLQSASFTRNGKFWMIPNRIWQTEAIFSSPDFGKSWRRLSTKFTDGADPSEIYFLDDKIGFFIADRGMSQDDLYRTLDGRKTWQSR